MNGINTQTMEYREANIPLAAISSGDLLAEIERWKILSLQSLRKMEVKIGELEDVRQMRVRYLLAEIQQSLLVDVYSLSLPL